MQKTGEAGQCHGMDYVSAHHHQRCIRVHEHQEHHRDTAGTYGRQTDQNACEKSNVDYLATKASFGWAHLSVVRSQVTLEEQQRRNNHQEQTGSHADKIVYGVAVDIAKMRQY